MKINSPAKNYTGNDKYGETVLEFKNGVAEFDGDLPAGVRLYLQGAGYGIDTDPDEPETPTVPDPREQTLEQIGTPLRDAAVDPKPEDFLAPTNAGKEGEQGNPHGPNVVSPEIHASQGVRPVKAGDVHVDDTDKQDAAETGHAEQETFETPEPAAPAGNASKADWHAYAIAQGIPEESLEDLSRDEIRQAVTNIENEKD
jgi:hypothetical protein